MQLDHFLKVLDNIAVFFASNGNLPIEQHQLEQFVGGESGENKLST